MSTAYGAEFRQDVINVGLKGGSPLTQIARDFGLSVTTLKRWIPIADRKETGAGPVPAKSTGTRELKKRNRLLEQENEILPRAAAYLYRPLYMKGAKMLVIRKTVWGSDSQ